MDTLTVEEEVDLLHLLYPTLDRKVLKSVASISVKTRDELKSEVSKLTTSISTRVSVEVAGLLFDGFKLVDVMEVSVYPFFSAEGGSDSERTFVKQIVQGFVDDGTIDPLFTPNDIGNATA